MFEGKDVKVLLSQAGSGKTRRLIEEVSKELETRRPEEIAFVTFTRKGAEEGLKRVCNKLKLDPEDLPYFRTLHSLTFHAMDYKANQMFGRLDQRRFNKEYGYNVNRCEVNTGKVTATKDSQYLDFYDLERSGALTSKQLVESDIEIGYYRQLVQKYEEYKSSQCLVDFFDCLIKYVREGDSLPCKVLFVDECFSPDTKVRMADMTVKEIKDIKIGDFVMGTNGATKVTAVHKGTDVMYDVLSGQKQKLFTCNSKHLILQKSKDNTIHTWKHCEDIKSRAEVFTNKCTADKSTDIKIDPYKNKLPCRVVKKGEGEYIGITVDAKDNLFLLANGCVVHNCQDITALQWQVIDKAFSKAEKIMLAGDENQCQPIGSKVLTKEGYKNIEAITTSDSLITFAQNDYCYYGKRQSEYHPEVAKRPFVGNLITVKLSDGTVNKFTPNHKMIVRWQNRDTSLRCVYLMKRGDWFRVGQCQLFNSVGATQLITRMNCEKAEECWILRICKTKEEALVWEQIYSNNFGIPLISWSKWYTEKMQNTVYSNINHLYAKAKVLLESVGKDIYYPLFDHEKINAKSGGTCLSLCEAINLIPEIMSVPVYQGKSHADKETLWQSFSVDKEYYAGYVYSMNVPKYHTYVTGGGLTVHNCIYSYSGARPDYLIKFAKQFPVEHLSVSYRIPQSVYRLAKGIVDFIGEKTDKPFNPRIENEEGSIVQLNSMERLGALIEEPENNPDKTAWYILARNNCFLDRAFKELEDNLIPYWTADGFFMGGEIMKRLTDYEGFKLEGYKDEVKKEKFQRKFGIEDFSEPFTETNLFTEGRKWVYASYIEKYGLDKLKEMCKWNPQILVSTIHHVKGGEAENVAIMLDATRKTKGNVFNNIDEELRILYVGVTRTKKNLFLIDSQNGEGYDNILQIIKDENKLEW